MTYHYDVRSDCGLFSGDLYISTIDSIGKDTDRRIVICYTDDYASHVDLFQIMGIAGGRGHFELYDAIGDGASIDFSTEINAINDSISRSGKLDIASLFRKYNHDKQTYIFRYVPARNDTCVEKDNMEVTVEVTRNLERDTEFKRN
jgi:hypothetical protein